MRAADSDADPENDQDRRRILRGETVPKAEDMPSVVKAKPCCDAVTDGAADGEGDQELPARHLESSGGKNKGAQRHRRRKYCRQRDGEDGVVFHPFTDALEDAWRNMLFEERHASATALRGS